MVDISYRVQFQFFGPSRAVLALRPKRSGAPHTSKTAKARYRQIPFRTSILQAEYQSEHHTRTLAEGCRSFNAGETPVNVVSKEMRF
jgi:hypothetical protein